MLEIVQNQAIIFNFSQEKERKTPENHIKSESFLAKTPENCKKIAGECWNMYLQSGGLDDYYSDLAFYFYDQMFALLSPEGGFHQISILERSKFLSHQWAFETDYFTHLHFNS